MTIEVKQISAKEWGLYLNGGLFGTSKARFDADFAKNVLENAVEGARYGTPPHRGVKPCGVP